MRMKPLLAVAALAVAIAGCTAPPQTHVTSVTQTTPSGVPPRVTLDVQGLGKAEVKASRLTDGPEQIFTTSLWTIFDGNYVGAPYFIVPKGAPAPVGGTWPDRLKANGDPATSYTWTSGDDYTHTLYNIDSSAWNPSWLKARFEGEGYAADGVIESRYGNLSITHTLGDAKGKNLKPLLTLSPEAPAELVFASWDGDDVIPFTTLDMGDLEDDEVETISSYRLELDFSVTSQDDKPLDGLTTANFNVRKLEIAPGQHDTDWPTHTLKARGNGQYTLQVDFRYPVRPETVSVDLALRNTPFVRDVEY